MRTARIDLILKSIRKQVIIRGQIWIWLNAIQGIFTLYESTKQISWMRKEKIKILWNIWKIEKYIYPISFIKEDTKKVVFNKIGIN